MKKLSAILAVICLLNMCILFSSCSEEKYLTPSYQTFELSSENFSDYLSVNVTYDYDVIYLGQEDLDINHYDIYCNVTIKTSPKCDYMGDYKFVDASVSYSPDFILTSGWTLPNSISSISASISGDGYSETTFVIFKQDVTHLNEYTFVSTNKDWNIDYTKVSGTVIRSLVRGTT